jgi:hypothetical protein
MRGFAPLWMGEMWNLGFCFIVELRNNRRTAPVVQLISCDVFPILRPLPCHVLYVTSKNKPAYISLPAGALYCGPLLLFSHSIHISFRITRFSQCLQANTGAVPETGHSHAISNAYHCLWSPSHCQVETMSLNVLRMTQYRKLYNWSYVL